MPSRSRVCKPCPLAAEHTVNTSVEAWRMEISTVCGSRKWDVCEKCDAFLPFKTKSEMTMATIRDKSNLHHEVSSLPDDLCTWLTAHWWILRPEALEQELKQTPGLSCAWGYWLLHILRLCIFEHKSSYSSPTALLSSRHSTTNMSFWASCTCQALVLRSSKIHSHVQAVRINNKQRPFSFHSSIDGMVRMFLLRGWYDCGGNVAWLEL